MYLLLGKRPGGPIPAEDRGGKPRIIEISLSLYICLSSVLSPVSLIIYANSCKRCRWYVRAPTYAEVVELRDRLKACFECVILFAPLSDGLLTILVELLLWQHHARQKSKSADHIMN